MKEALAVSLLSTARAGDASPHSRNDLATIRESVAVAPNYRLAEPDFADVIIVVGSGTKFWSDLLQSEIYAQHHAKLYVFDLSDMPVPILPGVYMTIPEDAPDGPGAPFVQGFYPRVARNAELDRTVHFDPGRLGWFRGALSNHPVRRALAKVIADPDIVVEGSDLPNSTTEATYADNLMATKFVLCPRGIGASTFRVFEAMRLGRPPVIISDDWREPPFVDWSTFSLRIMEADVGTIPELLRANEPRWREMGETARAVWEKNFSISGAIDWLAQTLETIPPPARIRLDPLTLARHARLAARHGLVKAFTREHSRRLLGRRTPFQAELDQWFA